MREKFSKIFEIPIQDIYTNPKMFQNRNEEFSKSTYEKIIREGFDKSEDPIIVWRDDKKNKYFVISGHSRLKAAQTLYNNGDDNLTTLPVKEFLGDLEGAISYATLESNRSGTPEGLLADVRAYKKAIKESCNKECLKGLFKTESYISTLQRLSYLDENGEFLRILNDAGQAKNFANIQKYAEWTGDLRKYYEDKLTDKHEKEIFDFLFTESNKLFRKDEFVNLIEKAINHITFDPSKPLNLKNFHSKSVYQIYAETEAEQVQKEIEELRDLLEKKQKLLARTEKEERQKEIELEISGINRNIVKKLESLDRLKEQAKEADKMQLDLFAPPAEKEEKNIQKTPKEQPKTPKMEQIETPKEQERIPEIEQEETPKNTYKVNSDGKAELYFDYEYYKSIPEDEKKQIKRFFLFSRNKKAWVSKAKYPNYIISKFIDAHNIKFLSKDDRLTFSEKLEKQKNNLKKKADRAEAKSENLEKKSKQLRSRFEELSKDWGWLTQPNINTSKGRSFTRYREKVYADYDKGMRAWIDSENYKKKAEEYRKSGELNKYNNANYVRKKLKETENSIKKRINLLPKYVEAYADLPDNDKRKIHLSLALDKFEELQEKKAFLLSRLYEMQEKEQPKEQTKEQPKTPKQDKKTLASIQKRIENLQIILSLNKKDTKIKQRIKDLELINAL